MKAAHLLLVFTVSSFLASIGRTSAQSTGCVPAPAGIIGWWPGETNVDDFAGTNNGFVVNGASFALGEVGQALSFNGVAASANIPGSPSLNPGNQVTIEFWMKADPINAMNTYQGLVTSDFYGIEIANGYSLNMGLNFFVSSDGGASVSLSSYPDTADANGGGWPVSAGQWHHVAGTYDGLHLQLYVDGQLAGNPYPHSGAISPMLTNSLLCIGSEDGRTICPFCIGARHFSGLIDEPAIYNRALSVAEIQAIYNAGAAGKCPPAGPATIATQPADLTVAAGNTATFTVLAGGALPLFYQWFFNSNLLTGATGPNLVLSNVQPIQAGYYSVLVSNQFGALFSSNALLSVLTYPAAIVSQPHGTNCYAGTEIDFNVTATGSPPLAFQWFKDGNALPGISSSGWSITHGDPTNSGNYFVIVTNLYGSATSSVAVVTVVPRPPCAPISSGLISWWQGELNLLDSFDGHDGLVPYPSTISYTPGKVGNAFSFSGVNLILVPDSPALHAASSFSLEAWINPSPTSASVARTIAARYDYPVAVLPLGTAQTNSSFFFGITNGGILCLSVSSNGRPAAAVSVFSPNRVPQAQWSHVAATYDGAFLQLYINGVLVAQTSYSSGVFAGTSDLGIGALAVAPNPFRASYWGWVGALDEVSFYNRALAPDEIQAIYNADVTGKCLIPPMITVQPQSQAVPLGEDVLFAPTVLGSKPLSYQWRRHGTNILQATGSTLLLEKIQTNAAGNYSVLITNTAGAILSSNATLTLLPAPSCTPAPTNVISWWPGDGSPIDVVGSNNAIALADITYPLGKVGKAFGFNGFSRLIVSNSPSLNFASNANLSIEAWVKVLPSPPNASIANFDNVPLLEKRSTAPFPPFDLIDSGYSLSLWRGRLAFWLGPVPRLVYPGDPGVPAADMFIATGPDLRDGMFHHVAVSLDRSITNGGNLYVDGLLVLNFSAAASKYVLSNSAPVYIGAPANTTSNAFFSGQIDELTLYGRALSASEVMAIRQAGAAGKCKGAPFIITQPKRQVVPQGQPVTFSVVAGGASPLSYQWRFGTLNIAGATQSSFTISSVQATNVGFYSVRVTNDFGSVTSTNAQLIINSPPVARCTNIVITAGSNCMAGASVDAGSYDPDGDTVIVYQTPLGPYPLGPTLVTLTAVDPLGASNNCVASVTVVDRTPPTIFAPHALVVSNDLNQCGAIVSFPFPTAIDNCSAVSITCTPMPGSFFPVGITPVHVHAVDAANNDTNYYFSITVLDRQPPVILCSTNITVEFSDETGAIVSFTSQATDNCAGSIVLLSTPPSGSTFAIGAMTVLSTAFDGAGNSNSCSFLVTVLGAQGVKSNVLAQLQTFRGSRARPGDLVHLNQAIKHLSNSLQPQLWLDQTHLNLSRGEQAFNEESAAVQELWLLLMSKQTAVPAALLQNFIDRIVRADRLLAAVAIHDATAAGADPRRLAQARRELAQGDEQISNRQYPPGLDHYRNAWKQAKHLTVQLTVQLLKSRLHLEAAAFAGETYVIETSTNMLDWTTLGIATANSEGLLQFDTSRANTSNIRFYRARLLP